jgi:hypothetical protein
LKTVAGVDGVVVGVVGDQQLDLLVSYISSSPPRDLLGVAVRPLVVGIVGNTNGV